MNTLITALALITLTQVLTGCSNIQRGADAGMWSLCNQSYPYTIHTDHMYRSDTCDRLWHKYNTPHKESTGT